MVAPPEPSSETPPAERVGQWLAVDLHRFEERTVGNNIECLVCLDECSGFLIVAMLPAKAQKDVQRGLHTIISVFNTYGHKVDRVLMVQSPYSSARKST